MARETGALALSFRQLSLVLARVALDFRLLLSTFRSRTCLSCFLVSRWQRQLSCAYKAKAVFLQVWAATIICFAAVPTLAGRIEVLLVVIGANGICGLLALPTLHQIFGENCVAYPPLACCYVGFPLLRAVCSGSDLRRQRRPHFAADQLLRNSVGAIESAAYAIIAVSLNSIAARGALAFTCLVKFAFF